MLCGVSLAVGGRGAGGEKGEVWGREEKGGAGRGGGRGGGGGGGGKADDTAQTHTRHGLRGPF